MIVRFVDVNDIMLNEYDNLSLVCIMLVNPFILVMVELAYEFMTKLQYSISIDIIE